MSQWRDLNPWPLPYQGSALPLSYFGIQCSHKSDSVYNITTSFKCHIPGIKCHFSIHYRSHIVALKLERATRFEPATYSLEGCRSTNWATPACYLLIYWFIDLLIYWFIDLLTQSNCQWNSTSNNQRTKSTIKQFIKSIHKQVGGEGFEPSKAFANGFTVRPSWPLWYPPSYPFYRLNILFPEQKECKIIPIFDINQTIDLNIFQKTGAVWAHFLWIRIIALLHKFPWGIYPPHFPEYRLSYHQLHSGQKINQLIDKRRDEHT